MDINIILDDYPTTTPSGRKIRTNFRIGIQFELLMQDQKLSNDFKIMQALKLYYYDYSNITDIEKAIDEILWFFKCGKKDEDSTTDENSNDEETKKVKRIYSYDYDDQLIFDAFLEQYHKNIHYAKYIHWWEFKAMFNGLNSNLKFVEIMSYRAIDLSTIKNKEMKNKYKKLKKIYDLPDMRSEEEKESDFANALW